MQSPLTQPQEPSDLHALVQRFHDTFNQADLDAVMAFFAEDALYVTFDGHIHRGKRMIRRAFEPQFRGDYGTLCFDLESMALDADTGTATLRWLCRHTIDGMRGFSPATQMKRLFYRSVYGQSFGWYGVDVIRFADGLVQEKHTYARCRLPLAMRNVAIRPAL